MWGNVYLEERSFDSSEAESVEYQANNINGHHGKELLCGIQLEFRYLHT